MKTRHIAVISPPWYPTPPQGYGGTELVVSLLVKSLRSQGHQVTLYGAEGSMPDTIELSPSSWIADLNHFDHQHREVTYACRVLEDLKTRDVDVVHDNSGWTTLIHLAQSDEYPLVHTTHLHIDEPRRTLYEELPKNVGLVAISDNQRNSTPNLPWAGYVHNAVDIDSLEVCHPQQKEDYFLCLARISPEKGQHIAIEVTKRTNNRLILAGKVAEKDFEQRYFDEQILPHIDGKQIVYIPSVAGREKAQLLSRAAALLAPLQYPEPFGLSMVETMASGTPVIAFTRGSAPELIIDGRTGFLVSDADEMVAALKRINEIDGSFCATMMRQRFGAEVMGRRYAEIYERMIARHGRVLPITGRGTMASRTANSMTSILNTGSRNTATAPAVAPDVDLSPLNKPVVRINRLENSVPNQPHADDDPSILKMP